MRAGELRRELPDLPTTCPDNELRPIQALSQAPTLAPILGVNAEADPSAICPVDARAVMVREALAAIPSGSTITFASDDLSFLLGAPIFAAQRLTARLKILPRRDTALSVFRKKRARLAFIRQERAEPESVPATSRDLARRSDMSE